MWPGRRCIGVTPTRQHISNGWWSRALWSAGRALFPKETAGTACFWRSGQLREVLPVFGLVENPRRANMS